MLGQKPLKAKMFEDFISRKSLRKTRLEREREIVESLRTDGTERIDAHMEHRSRLDRKEIDKESKKTRWAGWFTPSNGGGFTPPRSKSSKLCGAKIK